MWLVSHTIVDTKSEDRSEEEQKSTMIDRSLLRASC
jgi:hypothetical protein